MGQYGMLADFPHVNFDKPCDGDCTIIGMKQGLEYPNGTNANINSGLWLHHSVIFAIGKGRSDPSCTQFDISIPHIRYATKRLLFRVKLDHSIVILSSLPTASEEECLLSTV